MERGDPRVGDLVASVAGMVGEGLAGVTGDIQHVIEQAIPTLQDDGFAPLLGASIGENIDVALQIMTGTAPPAVVAAPAAAVDYAVRLAQQDVPGHGTDPRLPGRPGAVPPSLHRRAHATVPR